MLTILYEDNEIIVCEKPAGTPSQSDKTGDPDMLFLLQTAAATPSVFPVHRLDRAVGGVMVFAKTKQSAAALSKAVQDGAFRKTYLSAVCGQAGQSGELKDFLLKNQRLNHSKVVPANTPNAKQAILSYKALGFLHADSAEALSLLEITLHTGRHHQIRVQLAHAGLPIWGDTKYNPAFFRKPGFHYIALWAYQLQFPHPASRKVMTFQAAPHKEYPFTEFRIHVQSS